MKKRSKNKTTVKMNINIKSEWRQNKDKISNAINTVSEKNNYSHVFSAGVPGMDVLLYARPSDDISLLVFEELGIDPPPTQE